MTDGIENYGLGLSKHRQSNSNHIKYPDPAGQEVGKIKKFLKISKQGIIYNTELPRREFFCNC